MLRFGLRRELPPLHAFGPTSSLRASTPSVRRFAEGSRDIGHSLCSGPDVNHMAGSQPALGLNGFPGVGALALGISSESETVMLAGSRGVADPLAVKESNYHRASDFGPSPILLCKSWFLDSKSDGQRPCFLATFNPAGVATF